MRILFTLPITAISLLVLGCGGSDSSSPPEAPLLGTLNIAISDAPMAHIDKVELVLNKLVMTDPSGKQHQYNLNNHHLDLLNYQGMESHLVVDGLPIAAGHYKDVHFILADKADSSGCSIENNSGRHPLNIEENRLPLHDFVIEHNQAMSITMEINLYQSMHLTSGEYHLDHRGIYSIDNREMGHLIGEVDPQWIADCETKHMDKAPLGSQFTHMAYLYSSDVNQLEQMADISPTRTDNRHSPFAVSPIHQDHQGNWSFSAGYLPAGDYRIGYSCLAHLDDPATDDINQGQFSLFTEAGLVSIVDGGRQTNHQCGNGHGGHGGHG
ncbi:DUF4382 domain-containing protein [uncultured Shewanella sp.]|uniref:DUF4382 domain-containing protein n=1 Tax=uncultured Shewanella sp. TaxID=173975 RepID=UPI0026352687|nr:DUF4382 domain-containing protein [uncultured Shewanella sp.]